MLSQQYEASSSPIRWMLFSELCGEGQSVDVQKISVPVFSTP